MDFKGQVAVDRRRRSWKTIAEALARKGVNIVIADISSERAQGTASAEIEKLGVKATGSGLMSQRQKK